MAVWWIVGGAAALGAAVDWLNGSGEQPAGTVVAETTLPNGQVHTAPVSGSGIPSIEDLTAGIGAIQAQAVMAAQQSRYPYLSIYSTFSPDETVIPYAPGMAPPNVTGEYVTNEQGQYLFANGAIADPSTGEVLMPPPGFDTDPATVEGSPEWLVAIQDSWDEDKVAHWRKVLSDQGYDVAPDGGWGHDLLKALGEYHRARYLNAGNVAPLTGAQGVPKMRDYIDRKALVEEAKAWGQVPFDEDLDDRTAQYFANRTIQVAERLARKHPNWTLDQVGSGAKLRTQRAFLDTPGVRGALQDDEYHELDNTLRNSIVSIAQVADI